MLMGSKAWGLTTLPGSWFEPGKRVEILKTNDFGSFGALRWPYAGYRELQIATYLSKFVSTILRRIRATVIAY